MIVDSQITSICAAHGLFLQGHDVDQEILVLHPSSLNDLPAAEALQTIAEELKELGYRWVSLDLEAE